MDMLADREAQVFEASAANKEIGAALTVPPNALRLLKSFGYEHKNLRSCEYRGVSIAERGCEILR
jgi:hypothetical protein